MKSWSGNSQKERQWYKGFVWGVLVGNCSEVAILLFCKTPSECCIASLPCEFFEVSKTNLLTNSVLLALHSRGREGCGSFPSIFWKKRKSNSLFSIDRTFHLSCRCLEHVFVGARGTNTVAKPHWCWQLNTWKNYPQRFIHTTMTKINPQNGFSLFFFFLLFNSPGIDWLHSHWSPEPFSWDGCPRSPPLLEPFECFAPVFTLFQYFDF